MTVRYEIPSSSKPLDTPMALDGDNGFVGVDSHTNPSLLQPGTLQLSENCRLDESTGTARCRKGMKRVSSNSNLLAESEIMAAARFRHPDDVDYICLAADEKAYLIQISNTSSIDLTEFTYQTRGGAVETVGTDSSIVQAYDNLYLFRGSGLRLPFDLDTGSTVVELGKYPLVLTGKGASDRTFDRPESRTITGATNTSPIKITATNHGYSAGDLITITDVEGNTNANGTFYIKVVTDHAFTLDGSTGNSSYTSDTGLAVTESSELPPASLAVYARSRLAIAVNRDEVQYSDVFSDYSFAATNYFKFNTGTSDSIVALLPVMDDGMLVLKRHSIMLQTSIGNLANTTITEVTRQMGCVSRKSAVTVGGAVFFLGDSGIYSIDFGMRGQDRVGTPITALRLSDNPLSSPIEDLIETIDFSVVDTECSGIWFKNRYWLAVPIQGTGTAKASKIIVYNTNLKAFESVDSSAVYIDDLVVGVYGKEQRLFVVSPSGKLLLVDENSNGTDEYGNGGSATTAGVAWKVQTRAYTLKDMGEKRWLYGQAGIATNDSTSTTIAVDVATTNPDSTASSHTTYAFSSVEDKLVRFGLKKRGYSVDLTFSSSAGRPELRRSQVEALKSDRLITTFE